MSNWAKKRLKPDTPEEIAKETRLAVGMYVAGDSASPDKASRQGKRPIKEKSEKLGKQE